MDIILRLSEALVFFRASGDNFLRSITRTIVTKKWNHFGIILVSFFRIILGLVCDHFGIILGSFGDHFRIILGSFWDYFRIILGSFWDHFRIVLGSFWDHFGRKNMKIQDEHGQILVSGPLDPRKMIS